MVHNPLVVSPGRTLLISIIFTIILGALLLALPCSSIGPLSWGDIIFTATSATCVTGLLTVPLSAFTWFGKMIILLLIQIGGLGFITLTVFFMSLFGSVGLGTQHMAGQLLEIEKWRTSKRLIAFIVFFTFITEIIGAVLIFLSIRHDYDVFHSIYYAIFHAISSFCSAGFSIFGTDLRIFQQNIPFLVVTSVLLLIGGLGFITWHEILVMIRSFGRNKRHTHLSLHSKIVLTMTTVIVVFTAVVLWFLERSHGFAHLSTYPAIINIFFNAIAYRSAGFTTLDVSVLHLATFFFIMIVSFIGSSPGSTGSGIKTTTFALFLGAIRAVMLGRSVVEVKKRRIPNEQIFKAMAILSLSLAWIATANFCLLISEEGWRFVDIMFEAFSSFANLGLSVGLTPELSLFGRSLIIISMLIGRIGSLTLILALKRRQDQLLSFNYPEERVLLG